MSAKGLFSTSETAAADDAETRLVRAAQANQELFGALYQRYVDAIYRYLQLRAGPDEAADLTQQVFLRAFTALPKYNAKGMPFSAWLFRIARNLATDHRRSSYRRPDELLPDVPVHSTIGTPEEVAIRTERQHRLLLLLRELDGDKRELLAMRFGAGLSSRQIAAVVGKNEAAVKKQLTRILRKLKENYGEY